MRQIHDGMRARVRTDDGEHSERLCQAGAATKLRLVAVTAAQRVFRCCDTRRSTTLQGRRHCEGFASPRAGSDKSRKRGAISMRTKGGVGHIVRR